VPTPTTAILASLLCVAAGCAAADAVPEIAPPKSWSNFVILPWQYQTSAPNDRALYESVNLHGFHIDYKDDNLAAFARETRWPFYVDHAAGKGDLHLGSGENLPNVAAVVRHKELLARPNSLADPATIERMHTYLRENIGAAKGLSVVAYAFDDEIGLGCFTSPAEVDTHPVAIAAYRRELEQEYGTIAKLNQEYGTTHADFAAIQPISFEQVRGAVTREGVATLNLAAWCDWRAAMDSHFAAVLTGLTRFANSLDDAVPAGFVGGQPPSAWGGYDYRKLAKAVQWIEAYDVGGTNEILRSFWSQKRPHVQTYFSSKDPKKDAWFLWYYLCQGNRGVIGWPEGWFANGEVAGFIKPLAETYKEVQGPVSQRIIDAEFQPDPVALYYSQPSIRMTWVFDAACHGQTWPNRLSSMDLQLSTANLTRVGWLKTLQDAGVQPTFVHQDHLLGGELVKRGIKVLVLNRTLCLSDAEAAAIKAFAKAGGSVVADHLCGLFDEHGKARASGALDDLFGVKRDLAKGWLNGTELTEVNGETAQSFGEGNWAQGAARYLDMAVFERGLTAVGSAKGTMTADTAVVVANGKARYLNLSPIGYLLHRSDERGTAWLNLVAGILGEAGLAPRVTFSAEGDGAKLVEALFWRNAGRTTMCVIRNIDRSATINGFGDTKGALGDGKVKLKIQFAKPVKDLRNERTGQAMGDGAAFEDGFTPWEGNVYSFAN
jgi:hypothetical protein